MDDAVDRLLTRVSKLETNNRLRGGHDYPAIIGSWCPQTNSTDTIGALTTASTSLFALCNCVMPMQNPKLAFRFFVKTNNATWTTAWQIAETISGTVIASGTTVSTGYILIEKHIDISAIFTYGTLANYSLLVSTTGGTASARPDYVGGSWTPDAAVAF